MTNTLQRSCIAAALLLVLVAVNWSIYAKERIKTQGVQIFLQLAPVDPRSLMQGDYMALRFAVAQEIHADRGGSVPLQLDSRRVATLAPEGVAPEISVRYKVRDGGVWLGTNAYFFEEGSAQRFSRAAFGEFRVDRGSGEAVLVALRDAQLAPL